MKYVIFALIAALPLAAPPTLVLAGAAVIRRAPLVSQVGLPTRPLPFIKNCDPLEREEPQLSVARLSPGRLLWIRTCGASDYNKVSRIYITDEGQKLLTSQSYGSESSTSGVDIETSRWNEAFTNTVYEPKSRTLSATSYATPQRNSGTREEWVWDGLRFRHARSMRLEQTTVIGRKPSRWPIIYQAKIVDR
jgi:hypothetical protein